jgi:glycosyltransferase involved in cell wall biosynthesis
MDVPPNMPIFKVQFSKIAKSALRNANVFFDLQRNHPKTKRKSRSGICVVFSKQLETNMTKQKIRSSESYPEKPALKPATWKHDRTSIIIPCYNEANRLHLEVFLSFARKNPKISFVFVDDGSKDFTINLLCGAMAALPEQVDVLTMARNAGKAEAVRHGLKFAAKRGDKYIAFLDADLATPLNAINDFISVADRLDNIDVVFGSRAGGLGRRVYRDLHRKLISLVCASMGRLATGLALKDTQCGAKLFRNTEHLINCLEVPFTAGWLFDVELFLRISNPDKRERKNFFEYPVLEWTEIPGSNIKISDVIKGGLKMMSLIFSQWKIRARFKNRRILHAPLSTQRLRSGEVISAQSIRAMEAIVSDEKDHISLDFSNVKTLGPSVFTTLTEVCESLSAQGKEVSIFLPDDADILSAARRSSITALFNCTIQTRLPSHFMTNSRFSFSEA